jgi:hypothetical protein
MEKLAILFVLLCAPCVIHAQSCDSYSASLNGGWKEISTAPRDGRKVEMLETYGVAPWYDLFYWRKPGTKYKEILNIVDKDGHWSKKEETFEEYEGRWVKASDQNSGVTEDKCLFWRPWTSHQASARKLTPHPGIKKLSQYAKAHHRGWSIDILNSFLDGLPQYCAVIFYEKTPGLAEFAGCDKDEDRAATRAVDQAEAYRPPKTIASGGPQ